MSHNRRRAITNALGVLTGSNRKVFLSLVVDELYGKAAALYFELTDDSATSDAIWEG